mgnify:FL=1
MLKEVFGFWCFWGMCGPVDTLPPQSPEFASEAATMLVLVPLVEKWEGKRNVAYLDRIATPPLWTVCYGHTKNVYEGMVKTDAECTTMLRAALVEYRDAMHLYFTDETKAERLPPPRDAAFSSMGYNVGKRGAGKSTATRRLNAGNVSGACQAIGWWNKAGGRVVRGLVNRRSEETKLCMLGAS